MIPVQYGACPCTGSYEKRLVEIRMTTSDGVVVLYDMPQGACPNCGSRVYKVGMLELIEAQLQRT